MTDEHFPTAPPPPTEADYEAIATAVMETVRGRWFLGEFAKRNRNADTELILERIDRIETLLREPAPVSPAERVCIDLVEMAKAIAQTRREIAAMRPDGDAKGTLSEASEELDSIVQTTERATSDILAAAERIQEVAWMLRERGTDGAICDALDQRATDIYSACSFQDLTGQRTRKVVDVLQFLENRIRAMIEIWGGAVPEPDEAPAPMTAPHVGEDRSVPHLEQQEIDRMMPAARPAEHPGIAANIAAIASAGPAGGIATAEAAVAAARPEVAVVATVMMPVAAVVGATALALDLTPMEVARQPEPAPEPEPEPAQQPQAAPESDAQPEAVPSSAAQPEPVVAPEPEPAAEIEAVATPSEPRADPATVLKRILAIIRAPNEPVRPVTADAEPVVEEASAAPDATAMSAEPAALPEVDTAQSGAAEAEPVVAGVAVVTTDLSGSNAAAVAVAAAETPRSDGGSAQLQEAAQQHAPQAAIDDEAADDILMPLPGRLTVDQAVDEMLKAPDRVDVAATLVPVGAAAPEPGAPNEPPAAAAKPVAGEMEPAAAAGVSRPFVIEVPELSLARPPAPASQQELAAEPQPERGQLEPESSPAAATAAAPEPPAPSAELRSEPMAPEVAPPTGAAVLPPPPPLEPVAEVPVPLVAPAPPALAASGPPPLPANAAAPPPPPPAEVAAARPAPRHPALAAIAALSDDDKIALFS